MSPDAVTRGAVISGLIEAVIAKPSVMAHATQIVPCGFRRGVERQECRVWGDHQRVYLAVKNGKLRNAECLVSITSRRIAGRERRLGKAPGDSFGRRERLLRNYRATLRGVEQRAGISFHPDPRHHVLEHSACP